MSIRPKAKRRLALLALCATVVLALSTAMYVVRTWQSHRTAIKMRAEGVSALEHGDYDVALHKLGRYLNVVSDDIEALMAYGNARIQVPEPNRKHLLQAVSVFRRVLDQRDGHVGALS